MQSCTPACPQAIKLKLLFRKYTEFLTLPSHAALGFQAGLPGAAPALEAVTLHGGLSLHPSPESPPQSLLWGYSLVSSQVVTPIALYPRLLLTPRRPPVDLPSPSTHSFTQQYLFPGLPLTG